MKYLKTGLSSSAWHRARSKYLQKFNEIRHNFSHNFVVEMLEGHAFHDSIILSIKLEPVETSYMLEFLLEDGYDSALHHQIILRNISVVKLNVLFEDLVWLYIEILPQETKNYSFEVTLSNNENIYVEFEKLEYSKGTKISDTS